MAGESAKRVLVTGGAGFIGSNFVHHLLHRSRQADATPCCPDEARYLPPNPVPPVNVLTVDALTYAGQRDHLRPLEGAPGQAFAQADITQEQALLRVAKAFRPECIVHFAAETHVDRSIQDALPFIRANLLGTQVVLDVARRLDVARVVHVSTDEVYGSAQDRAFSEDDALAPSNPYAATKAGSDLLALAAARTHGVPTIVTRATNNFGPRQHNEKLIPKTIAHALLDRKIPVYGTGRHRRDWLYVKDHCAALALLLDRGQTGRIYNVAGGDERMNLDVVHAILDRLGKPRSLVQNVEDRPAHDERYLVDDARLRALGWKPRTRFDDGLDAAITWGRTSLHRSFHLAPEFARAQGANPSEAIL